MDWLALFALFTVLLITLLPMPQDKDTRAGQSPISENHVK